MGGCGSNLRISDFMDTESVAAGPPIFLLATFLQGVVKKMTAEEFVICGFFFLPVQFRSETCCPILQQKTYYLTYSGATNERSSLLKGNCQKVLVLFSHETAKTAASSKCSGLSGCKGQML